MDDRVHWSRGTSKRTGEGFWSIPGSVAGTAHYATSYGCTCKSFEVRGVCSHIEAVKLAEALEDERLGLASEAETDCAFAAVAADLRPPLRRRRLRLTQSAGRPDVTRAAGRARCRAESPGTAPGG